MKYNEKELIALACEGGSDKEGLLYKKGGQKGQSYQPRWFRLKGNLLFYFKANDKGAMASSEPQGAIVLEKCLVKKYEHQSRRYCFSLGFDDDDSSRLYHLACLSARERDAWMSAIQKASYEHLRLCMKDLQDQLIKLTGRDPMEAFQEDFRPDFSPRIKRSTISKESAQNSRTNFVFSSAAPTSDMPAMEIAMACVSLPKNESGNPPSTSVTVQAVNPAFKSRWFTITETDTIESKCDPEYFSCLAIETGHEMTFTTQLKFVVKDQSCDRESPSVIGEARCLIKDVARVVQTKDGKLKLPITKEGVGHNLGELVIIGYQSGAPSRSPSIVDIIGTPKRSSLKYTISVQVTSSFLSFRPIQDRAIVAQYRFPARAKAALKVIEEMRESLFTCSVPIAYLQMLCNIEHQRTIDLYELGQLSDLWEMWRKDLLRSHFTLIGEYEQLVNDFKKYKGPYFKRSSSKKDKDFEFLATNLHVQIMTVLPHGRGESTYHRVTFGAPVAHARGFKHGGLKKILADSKSSFSVISAAEEDSVPHKIYGTLDRIEEIGKCVAEGEKQILKAVANYQTGLLDPVMTQLSSQVQQLMQICRTDPTKSALNGLKTALTRRNCVISSELASAQSQRSDWTWNGSEYVQISSAWCLDPVLESLTAQLTHCLSALDDVSSKIHQSFPRSTSVWHQTRTGSPVMSIRDSLMRKYGGRNQATESTWAARLLPAMRNLVRSMEGLSQIAIRSLKFHLLELDGRAGSETLHNVKIRRDIVVSQALSALVTSFQCTLSAKIHDLDFCRQLAEIGFLVCFESLLNLQGNEKGMLEDFFVAVRELTNFAFVLVESDSEQMTHSSVVFKGSRSFALIQIGLTQGSFNLLPSSLKRRQQIKIVPILFNQAVIPQQFHDLSSNSQLQEEINTEGLTKLSKYLNDYRKAVSKISAQSSLAIPSLVEQLSRAQTLFQNQKSRNVDFLAKIEQLCRRLNGGYLTSCKSAKDRTGMAVTYEQCLILGSEHDLLPGVFQGALNAMRSRGTRLENCNKNIGARKYAFTSLQLKMTPKQYVPPEGTYGRAKIQQ
ncbi:inositol polyphosphate-4-phosphatase type I A-like [Oscarella lobularis]|uniref:inositol polyphosphate-4-phosphatase type I A-like n=1 Tax=Oscarella lobularis TaxID=121494 RepID=UPI00331396C4